MSDGEKVVCKSLFLYKVTLSKGLTALISSSMVRFGNSSKKWYAKDFEPLSSSEQIPVDKEKAEKRVPAYICLLRNEIRDRLHLLKTRT